MSFPRRHSELAGQSEVTSEIVADYRDYDAIAARKISHGYKFKVMPNGTPGYYKVLTEDGSVSLASTDSLDAAVNDEALNGLTESRDWKEKVVLSGDLIADAALDLYPFTLLDLKQCRLTLAPSTTANVINVHDTAGEWEEVHVEIDGGLIDCNASNSGNGCGIYAHAANWLTDLKLINNKIINVNASKYGMDLSQIVCQLKGLRIDTTTAAGGLKAVISDSTVSDFILNTQGGDAMRLFYAATNALSDGYLGGSSSDYYGGTAQLYMEECYGNSFSNIRVDSPYDVPAFYLNSCQRNQFNNFFATDTFMETSAALLLYNSLHNQFNIGYIGDLERATDWDIGISETGTSDYNCFTQTRIKTTGTPYSLGTHSKIYNSLINTTWV